MEVLQFSVVGRLGTSFLTELKTHTKITTSFLDPGRCRDLCLFFRYVSEGTLISDAS